MKDYNDNAPTFVDDPYEATVKEDALPGTVVVKLLTADKDSDLNTTVDFYITAGDPRSQFQVRLFFNSKKLLIFSFTNF